MKLIKIPKTLVLMAVLTAAVAGITFVANAVTSPSQAVAATAENCTTDTRAGFLGLPVWYKYLTREFVDGGCDIVFEMPRDIGLIMLAVGEILIRIAGFVAVGFIVYGGVQYILSQGDSNKTVSARHTIINALVGMIIAIIATFIVNLIGRSIT